MTTATSPLVPGDTERIRIYQADAGLVVDGVLGPMTRSALIADELASHITEFVGFAGSFGLLIRCEGFKGRPYWPGGQSGVTLDYGWDLGQQSESDLRRLYGSVWHPQRIDALSEALGRRGKDAERWIALRSPVSREWWPITREQAAQILPRAAAPYWLAAVRACPALAKAPARVQTAMLSVTYSAWIGPALSAKPYVEDRDWAGLAAVVLRSKGAKGRRELEAQLIESVRG